MLKYIIIFLLLTLSLLGFYPQRVVSEEIHIKVIEPTPPPDIKVYAKQQVVDRWGEAEWGAFNAIVMKESKWIHTAQNPHSSAYGIGQFLNSTWATVGCKKTDDKYKQVDCTIEYIKVRYKTPTKALNFHKGNNYY